MCVHMCMCVSNVFTDIPIPMCLCDKDIWPVLLLLSTFFEQDRQATWDISTHLFWQKT